jgi:hypothetical protein
MHWGMYYVEWFVKEHQKDLLREVERNRRRHERNRGGAPISRRRKLLHSLGHLLMAWGAALDRQSRMPSTDASRSLPS